MISIETGKCYKVYSTASNIVYVFKIDNFVKNSYYFFNNIGYYLKIETNKGFVINTDIKRMKSVELPLTYIFQEIEENDLDKLEHYYTVMETSFNSILNKYK